MARLLSPVTPGEILAEDFMKPLGLSINRLARALDVPANRISQIVNGQRVITADTALRLERYFGVDAQTWLNLQSKYELKAAQRQAGKKIQRSVRPREAA